MRDRWPVRMAGPRLALALGPGLGLALALGLAVAAAPGAAQTAAMGSGSERVSLRDTFPVGSNGLCEAQILAPEPGAGLLDRRYSVICRDAAAPVGTLWVVHGPAAAAPPDRLAGAAARCAPEPSPSRPALPRSAA